MADLNIKKQLASSEVSVKLRDIAKTYGVNHEDLLNYLNKIVDGEITEDELASVLEDELDISYDNALGITLDLRAQILSKMKEGLLEIQVSQKEENLKKIVERISSIFFLTR